MRTFSSETVSVYVKDYSLEYTQDGLQRLANLLKATMIARGWKASDLALKSGLSKPTISRYVGLGSNSIKKPQPDVLRALAPHILRAISIDGDFIVVHQSLTYGDDWIGLARIATDLYVEEAQSLPSLAQRVGEFLKEYQTDCNLTDEELSTKLRLSPKVTKQLLSGESPSSFQNKLIRIASVIPNPGTGQSFADWQDLVKYLM